MIYAWNDFSPSFAQPSTSWFADNATIIGNIDFGSHTSVWFGAVIRGDNSKITIGDYTNIQENVVVHTDASINVHIGNYVTVGHLAMLHGCTIGDNTLIGMHATVLNNAHIGKNCIIGANTLIPEGKVIPDNSVVMGVPGKVVKQTTPEAIAKIRASAQKYAQHSQTFKNTLVPIG